MTKSYLLVGIQFSLIAVIVWYCGVVGSPGQNIATFIAGALGIWAIATMRLKVNVLPDVRTSQALYTNGPYAYIRHPMYTAVLFATAAWVTNRFEIIAIVCWLVLLADLLYKLHYEERMLQRKFPSYSTYMQHTKRLIPFVY